MKGTRRMMRTIIGAGTKAALIAPVLLAGGCVSFGTKPPARLLGIPSTSSIPAGKMVTGTAQSAIMVMPPLMSRSIGTPRVAVIDTHGNFAYVKDAIWVDTPDRLFQGLLRDAIAVRTDRLVLNPDQFVSEPSGRLLGQLIAFTINDGTQQADVIYDASLVAPDGTTISTRRFSASAPIGRIDAETVAPAIGKAANTVAEQVADWVKTQPK
jgi:cholesterol transport system auxiliary component